MIAAYKAELRKIFSLRSTYIILALSLALEVLFAFYLTGWRAQAEMLASSKYLSSQVVSAINPMMLFGSMVGILLVTHEYRYNTIMYTLTISRSRSKTLFAKFLAITLFALVFTAVFGALSPLLSMLAIKLHSLDLAPQQIYYSTLIPRVLFAGWAFIMLGFILALIIRAQVGAIATIFLVPGPIESIFGFLLLKKNAIYLPFTANNILLDVNAVQDVKVSYTKAAMIVGGYVIGGLIIAWVLFLRRDAN